MPKLKTNRAAAKRFRKTAKGFKRYAANRRHNLGHKDPQGQAPARSGGSSLVHKTDTGRLDAAAAVPQVTRARTTHGTSQTWRDGRAPSQESSRQGEGLLQRPAQGLSRRQAGRHQGRPVRLPRPARRRSASSARCGSRASTRRRACTACPTAASSTA